MNIPPLWKLKRELSRVKNQFIFLPQTVASWPSRALERKRREKYLQDFTSFARETIGAQPLLPKVCIFLIYQPNTVATSIFETIRWMSNSGYAVFCVVNSTLSASDRSALILSSWRVLERPNFGYDFGGYQDAIKILNRDGISPDVVTILNDSIWVFPSSALMEQLEEAIKTYDIYGFLVDEKVNHDLSGGTPSKKSHVESYFYIMGSKVWLSSHFQYFWNNYKMTDYKPNTIKYGEIGFSRQMMAAGFRVGVYSSRKKFLEAIREKDNRFIEQTLNYGAYADRDVEKSAKKLEKIPKNSEIWREAALEHIRRAVNRKRFNATFPFANEYIFGTQFMKKSSEPIFSEMRHQYLRAVDDGAIRSHQKVILDEIKRKNKK